MTDVREAPANENKAANDPTGDFIWYEVMTPDPEGSKAFYDAVVGWDISPEGPPEYNGYRMINRSDGKFAGGVLPLTPEMQQHGARPTWLGYLHVNDVDKAVNAIEAASGKSLMTSDIPNVGRIAMVTDPQGAPFYVMKPIPPEGDPNAKSDVFSPDAEQRVGWNELQTSDVEAARRFYGDQFGWGSSEFMDMGPNGEYRFFDHHGVMFGALFDAKNGLPPHWRFYFRVPSIKAAKETAEQKGGTIHMGPHQIPTGEWILIGSDPQGAEFALVGKE